MLWLHQELSDLNNALHRELGRNRIVAKVEMEKALDKAELIFKMKDKQILEYKTCCPDQHGVAQSNYALPEESLTSSNSSILRLSEELEELKNSANRLKMENFDLRRYIRQLRYTEHPGNYREYGNKDVHALKNVMNQLKTENEDLKSYIRSLRYASYQKSLGDEWRGVNQVVEKSANAVVEAVDDLTSTKTGHMQDPKGWWLFTHRLFFDEKIRCKKF